MKFIFALILCALWQREANAANYTAGYRDRYDDVLLYHRYFDANVKEHVEIFPGPYDYSPFLITRIEIHDRSASTMDYMKGGVQEAHFEMKRTNYGSGIIRYRIAIYGKFDSDECRLTRTAQHTERLVDDIKKYN